ncbi:hypothetical protein KBD08_03500 [Candidatus Babeliales bacterium]|nr:hypothetical protein [Candidatus Babeliales bacterium]
MQKHIVRKSDIRGVVGVDVDLGNFYVLTQSFLVWLKNQAPFQRVIVGMDGRLHSHDIYQKVSQAIIDAGYQVYFVGVCPTPVLVHALYHLSTHVGIMITASSAGSEYNGLKLYAQKTLVEGIALQEIYDIATHGIVVQSAVQGKIIPCPIVDHYIDTLKQYFSHLSKYDFSVIVDTGHGTMGPVVTRLIQSMEWKNVQVIRSTVEPIFATGSCDVVTAQHVYHLREALSHQKDTLGVAFDGDGDRCAFIDETNTFVSSERMAAIFAQQIVHNNPSRTVVHDLQDAMWLDTVLYRVHGKTVTMYNRSKSFTDAMLPVEVVFGVQQHGRYFFKDRHFGYPDGLYTFLRLLDILVQRQMKLRDLVVAFPIKIIGLSEQTFQQEY